MIQRLKRVRLNNFRCFKGSHDIPFGGDIVLLYGANGAGKSSLLYAIECALTGSVLDLARYADDYPQCLQHVGGDDDTSVAVDIETKGGSVATLSISVKDGKVISTGAQLSAEE